jgi:hypothetical protein
MLFIFLSTSDSIVALLTLELPEILTFAISASEVFDNIKKNIIENFNNLLSSCQSYIL